MKGIPLGDDGLPTTSPRYAQQVKRPPIGIVFRIENLSATYKAKIAFQGSTNAQTADKFNIGEDLLNATYADPNILNKRQLIPGLGRSMVDGIPGGEYTLPGDDIEHGFREREHFLDAKNIGEFSIPVRPQGIPANSFVEGEQFVVVYCPNPGDAGSIGFKSPMKLFYDDSPFAQTWEGKAVFNALSNRKNSYRKCPNLRPENKFHFVTFPIAPMRLQVSHGVWTADYDKRFKAYKTALDRLGYNYKK